MDGTQVEAAIRAAAAVAGDRIVHVMGGASIIQQALRAGLVDRLSLHVAPLLLGAGTPLFTHLGGPVALTPLEARGTPDAAHLTYLVGQAVGPEAPGR